MSHPLQHDYTALDQPEILARIFHPRPEHPARAPGPEDILIPVADGRFLIGSRYHGAADQQSPTIVFFHGNGEIAADYDDLGPVFARMGITLWVVDYRGYGRSTGTPTVSAMMADCHSILSFVRNFLTQEGSTGSLTVMGRSLGSASALELAMSRSREVDHLIIESGFARTDKLLRVLGIESRLPETFRGFDNLDKIRHWHKPLRIIHGESDWIIPFSDGRDLFDACPAVDKKLVKISGAGHNDLFLKGFDVYMQTVSALVRGEQPLSGLSG